MESAIIIKASDEEDRLSALPDGVICHILSFLPTQRSVQTSILAKRWRTLWAHVPVLDFEGNDGSSYTTATFSCIVCTVLLCHEVQSLNTFRLICPDGDDGDYGPMGCYELETCIATVVKRNVQNLHLALRVEVPRCLLTCKTLVDLTMILDVSMPPTAPFSLPNLKKLYLYHLDSEVDFTRLVSGCPVLEELSIHGTRCRDPRGCYISSPTLKRLTIIYFLDQSMFNYPSYMVTINTPALRYLEVHDDSFEHISISLCTSLVEANLNVGSLGEPDGCWLLKLLDSVRNVKSLNFTDSYEKICEGLMDGSIAKFGNLAELKFSANWWFLSKFLESADHLQVLTICEDGWHSKDWMEPIEEQFACLFSSLRIVRIDGFRRKEQSFNMVRYILKNALVLERMEMDCPRWHSVSWKEKFDAIQRISLFRRGSMKCEVAFS